MRTLKKISSLNIIAFSLCFFFTLQASAENCNCVTRASTLAQAKSLYTQKCELERGFFAPVCKKFRVRGRSVYTCSYKTAYKPWKGMESLVNNCRMSYKDICVGHSKDSSWGWNGNSPCRPAQHMNLDACFDYDGDGWGWNGLRSCFVPVGTKAVNNQTEGFLNAPEPSPEDFLSRYPACLGDEVDSNEDGFGWENGKTCVHIDQEDAETVLNQETVQNNYPECKYRSSDVDGDGFGWEDGKTCNVTSNTADEAPATEPEEEPVVVSQNNYAPCQYISSDKDKDGFGWENGKSCVVTEDSVEAPPAPVVEAEPVSVPEIEVTQQDTQPEEGECLDSDGDGWGWNGVDSCKVQSGKQEAEEIPEREVPVTQAANVDETVQAAIDEYKPVTAAAVAGSIYKGYCFDDDNDGWGDNNIIGQSCKVSDENLATYANASYLNKLSKNYGDNNLNSGSCIDVDQDGYGSNTKNPKRSCKMESGWRDGPFNFRKCYPSDELHTGVYSMQNNQWNSGSMFSNNFWSCIELKGDKENPLYTWSYDYLDKTKGVQDQVKGYMQVYYGKKEGATPSGGDNSLTSFPLQVKDLKNIRVDYKFSEDGFGERNVAIESFFHSGGCNVKHDENYDTVDPNYDNIEMMVWVGRPIVRRPGNKYVGKFNIDGRDWHLWLNSVLSHTYLAFASEETIPEASLNWSEFVNFTRGWLDNNSHKYRTKLGRTLDKMTDEMCMPGVEMGTEVFWGKGNFELEKFEVKHY